MLDKVFDPAALEQPLYEAWEAAGLFTPRAGDPGKEPYVLMMPPPNVTGVLHMGHALTYTLPDILVRYHRMRGHEVLWQPGMDHAGIATQVVVEQQLAQEGITRHDLGREAFIQRVWAWKEASGGTILTQQRRLGLSPDWSRGRFTLDEGLSKSVRKAFVTLYKEGLIYRDKRLVNWDPTLLTAISDLEVTNEEVTGQHWYIRYPLENEPDRFVTIATSRPETLLGDAALAVHPEDERYQHLIGHFVFSPLAGRRLPIIADAHSDPEKGTGVVKIGPAHDFNDFEVGRRHGLEALSIFDCHARLNDQAPEVYRGLDRFEARKKIIEDLESRGLLERVENVTLMLPKCERTGVVVEPFLTDQWFVDAERLAKPALKAIQEADVALVPEQWKSTYYHWLENIHPWCLSRQLWWGHQIPAWYGPEGSIYVAETEEEARSEACRDWGQDVVLTRDEDVLDTWFSAALWPFSTLGWPQKTPDLERYYPTSVLVTGLDILFFWVARMMMMGYHFMGTPPFKTIYLHALVRDAKGQKMSKTKGNSVDPLALIDRFGADALRFTLAALAAPGRNINFCEKTIEGYRNFATKLWNSARFCEHYEAAYAPDFDPQKLTEPLNRWLVSELSTLLSALEEALGRYRFDEAAHLLYQFTWGTFCDWYLEFAKPLLSGENLVAKHETAQTAPWALAQLCHLLHPFMPYMTEKLWMHLTGTTIPSLSTQAWPSLKNLEDRDATELFRWVIEIVTQSRSLRSEMACPPSACLVVGVEGLSPDLRARLTKEMPLLKRMIRAEEVVFSPKEDPRFQGGTFQSIFKGVTLSIPVEGVIDVPTEIKRLEKSLSALEKTVSSLSGKLSNQDFLAKAPEAVLDKNRARLAEAEVSREKALEALDRLRNL